jgi:hypothetical protein
MTNVSMFLLFRHCPGDEGQAAGGGYGPAVGGDHADAVPPSVSRAAPTDTSCGPATSSACTPGKPGITTDRVTAASVRGFGHGVYATQPTNQDIALRRIHRATA